MRRLLFASLLLAAVIVTAGWVRAEVHEKTEEEAVRAALEHYLQGHATGDGEHFKAAFYDGAVMYGIRDGKLRQVPIPQFIANAPGKPAADEAQRKRRIVSVDVTGDAAAGKIELDYPTGKFTDYMSLLKIDGQWKIVNKIYTLEAKR